MQKFILMTLRNRILPRIIWEFLVQYIWGANNNNQYQQVCYIVRIVEMLFSDELMTEACKQGTNASKE